MSDESRRFTDREVALVLRRASELDEVEGASPGTGLSLEDLTEIAKEVGISPDAIHKVVATLDRGRDLRPALVGAPLVHKAVHAVPAQLNQEAISRLIRLIDERTDGTGVISEALGSVRWTTSDRMRSTRVSITPGDGETWIEVVEKAAPRIRRVFHLLPAAWSVMLAGPVVGMLEPSALGLTVAVALSLGGGLGIGRAAWSWMSAQSARRVHRLAESLSAEGREAATKGLVTRKGDSGPA